MKISYFKSVTPPFAEDGSRLLYSLRTTRLLKISYDIGEQLIHGQTQGFPEELQKELIDMKILIPDTENELEEIILENQSAIEQNRSLNFTIFTTANCQPGMCLLWPNPQPTKIVAPSIRPHIAVCGNPGSEVK